MMLGHTDLYRLESNEALAILGKVFAYDGTPTSYFGTSVSQFGELCRWCKECTQCEWSCGHRSRLPLSN